MESNLKIAYRELKSFVQKALPVGTRREWSGKPYLKTNTGWKPVASDKQPKAEQAKPVQKPTQQPVPNIQRQKQLQAKKKTWQDLDNKGSDINKLIGKMTEAKDPKLKDAMEAEIKSYGQKKGYDQGSINRAILEAKGKSKTKKWGMK